MRAWLVLTAACALSCTSQVDSTPCRFVREHVSIVSGSVTLRAADGTTTVLPVVERSADPPDDTCSVLITRDVFETHVWQWIVMYCRKNGQSVGEVQLGSSIADPRGFAVGSAHFEGADAGFAWWGDCTDSSIPPTMDRVVTIATGASAPYPQLVTPEYVRRYSVTASACGFSMTLDLEQRASDFVYHANGVSKACLRE
jgi:hypothetical protein